MFMQKIELPAVTCDLFNVTKGFDGTGGDGRDCGKGPRVANLSEARAYADFIRRKNNLPDIGAPQMQSVGGYTGRGRTPAFHYIGATYGEVIESGRWDDESPRRYIPAQYEPGAFSVLFPGANQMRQAVTFETLDDAGEVVTSSTMPVEPKKGGIVWSKDEVRKACGPVAKVKAARRPTVANRRAAPTVDEQDKRRRAIMVALKLRAELRRMRAEARQKPEDCAAPVAPTHHVAQSLPDAILSDLAAAERLMRGDTYVAPAPSRLHAGMRIVLHCASYRGLLATVYHKGTGVGWAAVTDCGRHLSVYPDADDAWSPAPTVDEGHPTAIQGSKRTVAHERAIRRAWAERKARRTAETHLRIGTSQYESMKAERDAASAERNSFALDLVQAKGNLRAMSDRARLAKQEAAEALAMRDEMRMQLAALERRAEMAEAENAELWAEIETLTAPVPALAA